MASEEDKNLSLIFVNRLGDNWKKQNVYEFIFSDHTNLEEVDGENWDLYPSEGKAMPPNEEFVTKIGNLETSVELSLVQESDTFSIWDAIDGVVALAWEDLADYNYYPDPRYCFRFGDNIQNVEDILYERDEVLHFKEKSKIDGEVKG